MKETIAVWFSCGAPSAVAAKRTIELYGKTHNILVVNNPVDEENIDNKRFMNDVSSWLGQEVIQAKNTKLGHTSAVKVWDDRKFMSGIHGAPCTLLLKKAARYEFELTHQIDWHVLGFTLEENNRHDRFVLSERANVMPTLINGKITRPDCFKIIKRAGIKLPISYELGYPNANCKGCVKATSPTYWNLVRKEDPEVFISRAIQSRRLGVKLVRYKGKRIFLDELPEDAKGNAIKSYECGIFCDTK
jgi:hypothetical protein